MSLKKPFLMAFQLYLRFIGINGRVGDAHVTFRTPVPVPVPNPLGMRDANSRIAQIEQRIEKIEMRR